MIDYENFPALSGVYLEDSYVLAINESGGRLAFDLEAVLTPENAKYREPRPGEQYCYMNGQLIFPNVLQIEWVRRTSTHFTDATGEEDLGNIDILVRDGEAFVAEGDWGRVRIFSASPIFVVSGE